MRILLLSHYYPPEVNAPANRIAEHARAWAAAGHEVHVVTCFPSHPRGVLYPGWRMRWRRDDVVEGVQVHRVWTWLAANRGVVRRTLNYLSFVPTAAWRAWRLGRFDVVLATSPQFFCAVAGAKAAILCRAPFVFEVRDLWPESIAAVGAVRRGPALRALERLELWLYRRAARVVCVTRAFVENLAGRGVPRAKLAYVPNGVDPGAWRARGVRSAVRTRLGLGPEDVACVYVGTVGLAHGIGTLLEAARRLRDEGPRVRFLVVGDGAERDALERRAAEEGLDAVRFLGQVPREEVPGIYEASDVALVLLRDRPTFRTVLPSKMFEAMAASRPVVLGVDGEARRVLEEAGGGLAVTPEDAEALADAVRTLAADPARRSRLGEAGARYVTAHFDRRAWAARYLDLLAKVSDRRARAEAAAGPTSCRS